MPLSGRCHRLFVISALAAKFSRHISTFANANSNARLQLAKNPYAFAYRIVPEQILNICPAMAMLINEVRTFCRLGG